MRAPALLGAALLLCALLATGACKGGAGAATGAGQANATAGGPGAAGTGTGLRTDRAPDLSFPEDLAVRAKREVELAGPGGGLRKYREELCADGQGKLRLDVLEVWDEASQSWGAPSQFLATVYEPRTFYLTRHRDLHLGLDHGLYSNYEWIALPGTVQMAGRDCERTRARSLRGNGDVELVHEVGTGLLLGWTVEDEAGQTVMRLTSTEVNTTDPDLASVAWVPDVVVEAAYDPAAHDPLLGMSPRPTSAPPAGFYLAERRFVETGSLVTGLPSLYVERWTDGLRSFFLAQHRIPPAPPSSADGMRYVLHSQEGGVRVAEADLDGVHAFAVGALPFDRLDLVLAGLLE